MDRYRSTFLVVQYVLVDIDRPLLTKLVIKKELKFLG
jgi:hypothetical protein